MDLEIEMVDIFQESIDLWFKITEKPPSYLEIDHFFYDQIQYYRFEYDEEKRKILDEIQFVEIEHVNSYSEKVKVKLDVRSKTMCSKFKFYPLTRIIDSTSETILLGVDNEGNLWTYQTTKKIVSQDLSKETSLFPSDLIVQRIKNPLKLSPPYSIPSKPNQTNISWLPNEILLEIFDWIGIETDYQIHKSLIQVCKQWRILIIEEYWKKRCEYSRMNFTLNHKQHSIILPISQSLHDKWYSEKFDDEISLYWSLNWLQSLESTLYERHIKRNKKPTFLLSPFQNKTKFTILRYPFGDNLLHNPFDKNFLAHVWNETIDIIIQKETSRIKLEILSQENIQDVYSDLCLPIPSWEPDDYYHGENFYKHQPDLIAPTPLSNPKKATKLTKKNLYHIKKKQIPTKKPKTFNHWKPCKKHFMKH